MNQTLTLFDHFNNLTPYAVGFDRLFDQLASSSRVTNSYPPYDILKDDDYNFKIEMALAGFSKKDIEVEVAENLLTIKSVRENNQDSKNVYKGISYRKFTREFTIADDIEVKDAKLEDGLLTIQLERIVPDEKKPKLIKIT
mgnify:FL=1|tara:strand:- start:845 stop:1267 length:423 start_codon:yes stop_codon:yes gene_type:complete